MKREKWKRRHLFLLFLFFLFSFFFSCKKHEDVNLNQSNVGKMEENIAEAYDPLRVRAAEIAASLDDRFLAAQIFICGIDSREKLSPYMISLFRQVPAGAVIFFRNNLNTGNDAIRSLTDETVSLIEENCKIPPFITVDHEGGTVNRFPRGTAALPEASSYWETALAEGKQEALYKVKTDSLRAGREIKELGFNLNLAPIAEYLNDYNYEFMKSRSYGPDPSFTVEAAAAFIQGMEEAGVLCVLKHFPGCAGEDPHYSASVIDGDRTVLDCLVSVFAALIKNGARAVMAAHTLVPALDDKRIASLSPFVLNNWLRGELKFDGIIISDDFSMAAAKGNGGPEKAAAASVASGADMVHVWPSEIIKTHKEFLLALEDGRLSRERLRDAAQRVIYEKLKLGLMR